MNKTRIFFIGAFSGQSKIVSLLIFPEKGLSQTLPGKVHASATSFCYLYINSGCAICITQCCKPDDEFVFCCILTIGIMHAPYSNTTIRNDGIVNCCFCTQLWFYNSELYIITSIFTHFLCFFPLKLLKLGEIDGVKFLAWKSGGVNFWTNSMSADSCCPRYITKISCRLGSLLSQIQRVYTCNCFVWGPIITQSGWLWVDSPPASLQLHWSQDKPISNNELDLS